MKKKLGKNIEWSILVCTILLIVIGLFAIYSATANSNHEEFKKQIMWVIISIPFFIGLVFIDYEKLGKISPIIFIGSCISLVAVLFTKPISGATSWFNIGGVSFQPSEFAKLSYIIFISFVISKFLKKGKKELNRFTRILAIFILSLIPLGLIIKQPDYGTASAFIFAIIFILFTSGIYKRYIIITLIAVAVIVPTVYIYVLPPHAKARINVFLNPEADLRGAGYNLNQSKIAIGAGQLFGMGYLKGNQTQLGFLHPKSTDFIFSVISEELGFIASALIIVLYVVLITKAINIAKTAKDEFGSTIASGIAGILFFHMLENIGMTIGLLPITGVPLPFVSYGGSSMLSNLMMIAMLLNISARRQKNIFIE